MQVKKQGVGNRYLKQIHPKIEYGINFNPPPPQYVYQISARFEHVYASYSNYCAKRRKKRKKFLQNLAGPYVGGQLEVSYSNLKCGLPANSTVNLMPFE